MVRHIDEYFAATLDVFSFYHEALKWLNSDTSFGIDDRLAIRTDCWLSEYRGEF